MDKYNKFIKEIYSSPALLWKLIAALLFLSLAFIIFFSPNLIYGLTDASRRWFSVLLLLYGCFRFYTFYSAYKRRDDE